MKKAWNYAVTMWQPAGALIAGCLLLLFLFVFRIGGLVPGRAAVEQTTRQESSGMRVILDNPINAPYKTAQFITHKVKTSIVAERLVNGLAAGISVLLFYLIARRFCDTFAAGFATVLYATSSSLLHVGRLASPQISLLMLMILFMCGYALRFARHHIRSWLYITVALGIALYTPGILYFVIFGIVWQFRAVKRGQEVPKPKILGACLFLLAVLLTPLILGFVRSPELIRPYLGIPSEMPHIVDLLKNMAYVPFSYFVRAPSNQVFRLGHQAVLDGFSAAMLVLGCVSLLKRFRLDRVFLLLGIAVITIVFSALTKNYEFSFILLPFIYLVVGIGISRMLDDWNGVFPLNPLARWLAVIVVGMAVLISVNFQTRRYFIAWPNNRETKATFNIR